MKKVSICTSCFCFSQVSRKSFKKCNLRWKCAHFEAKWRRFLWNDQNFDTIFVWMKVEFAQTRSGLTLSNIELTFWNKKASKKNASWNSKICQNFVSRIMPKILAKFYNKSKSLCCDLVENRADFLNFWFHLIIS